MPKISSRHVRIAGTVGGIVGAALGYLIADRAGLSRMEGSGLLGIDGIFAGYIIGWGSKHVTSTADADAAKVPFYVGELAKL